MKYKKYILPAILALAVGSCVAQPPLGEFYLNDKPVKFVAAPTETQNFWMLATDIGVNSRAEPRLRHSTLPTWVVEESTKWDYSSIQSAQVSVWESKYDRPNWNLSSGNFSSVYWQTLTPNSFISPDTASWRFYSTGDSKFSYIYIPVLSIPSPIPEPGTWLTMLLGLAGIALLKKNV